MDRQMMCSNQTKSWSVLNRFALCNPQPDWFWRNDTGGILNILEDQQMGAIAVYFQFRTDVNLPCTVIALARYGLWSRTHHDYTSGSYVSFPWTVLENSRTGEIAIKLKFERRSRINFSCTGCGTNDHLSFIRPELTRRCLTQSVCLGQVLKASSILVNAYPSRWC